jgi:hypothetical protein
VIRKASAIVAAPMAREDASAAVVAPMAGKLPPPMNDR